MKSVHDQSYIQVVLGIFTSFEQFSWITKQTKFDIIYVVLGGVGSRCCLGVVRFGVFRQSTKNFLLLAESILLFLPQPIKNVQKSPSCVGPRGEKCQGAYRFVWKNPGRGSSASGDDEQFPIIRYCRPRRWKGRGDYPCIFNHYLLSDMKFCFAAFP